MKNRIVKLFFGAVLSCCSVFANHQENGDSENNVQLIAARALWGRLVAKHHQYNIHRFTRGVKDKHGLSDENIATALIRYIKRDQYVAMINGVDPDEYVLKRNAIEASRIAMQLYPGDCRLEQEILHEFSVHVNELSSDSDFMQSWYSAIERYGSEECVDELRAIIDESGLGAEIVQNGRSKSRFKRGGFPEGLKLERKWSELSGFSIVTLAIMLSLIYMLCVMIVVHRRRKSGRRSGVFVLICCLVLFLFFAFWIFVRTVRWGEIDIGSASSNYTTPSEREAADERDVVGSQLHTLESGSVSDTGNAPEKSVTPVPPGESTPYEQMQQEMRMLMAPFSVEDPRDRAGNIMAREAAAMKLMDLLKTGMPEGCREENWPMIVQQIIGVQSCTPASMDRAMEMVGKWIGDPSRTEQETMTALIMMMRWQQTGAYQRGTPEFQRFEQIAEMQVEMFEKSSPLVRARLLWNLEQAAKIVSKPKSQMSEKLIDDERLLEMVGSLRRGAAGPAIGGQALMILSNRLRDQPEGFPVFENAVKEMLAGDQTDVMGRLSALEMLTSRAKGTGSLPEWAGDAEIARQLFKMRAEAVPRGADGQPTGKEPGFINEQAVAVIRNRVARAPEASREAYGQLLNDIAGDSSTGPVWRIEAVRLAVKAGALSADDARHRFVDDPAIGKKVSETFPE